MATIIGTDNADNINGTADDDDIFGRRGDDFIFSFAGNDLINWFRGDGNTQLGQERIAGSDGSDLVDGGDGIDRFRIFADDESFLSGRNSFTGRLSHRLEAGTDGVAIFTTAQEWYNFGTDSGGTSREIVTLRNVEQLSFSATRLSPSNFGGPIRYDAIDTIVVGNLTGTALTGLLFFDLGADADSLDASAAVNVIVALGGDAGDILRGGSGNDELHGDAGDDQIWGGGGVNALIGGTGNDVYYSDNRGDTVIEEAGEGYDQIQTTALHYVSRMHIELLQYQGSGNFVGIGTDLAETIIGATGDDYLIGFDGDDILISGTGSNALQGGRGNDTYYVQNLADTLIEFAGEGVDRVVTQLASYTLRDHFEQLELTGSSGGVATGNALDNVLTGTAFADNLVGLDGNDILIGGGGANLLEGGRGNDIYRLSSGADTVLEFVDEGIDLIELQSGSHTISANVENLIVTGGTGAIVTGNQLDNRIEGGNAADRLSGERGNDMLLGGDGADILSGGDGDDVLIGGAKGDELAGGTGADRYVFLAATADGQDLLHDFVRGEGDTLDVAALLQGTGVATEAAWTLGYFTKEAIVAFGSGGGPATRVYFDPDGSAGAAARVNLVIVLGSTDAVQPGDFIYV